MAKPAKWIALIGLAVAVGLWQTRSDSPQPSTDGVSESTPADSQQTSAKPETFSKQVEQRYTKAQNQPLKPPKLSTQELKNAPSSMTAFGPSVFSQAKEKFIQKQISDLEQFVKVDEGVQQEVSDIFENEWQQKLNSFAPLHSSSQTSELKSELAEVVGEKGAAEYLAFREEQQKEEAHRQLASRVTVLSQTLDLNMEQEKMVQEALVAIDRSSNQRLSEALAKSDNPDNPNERMRQYQAISEQNRLELQTQLESILSPEQYEAYVKAESERKPVTPGANPFR